MKRSVLLLAVLSAACSGDKQSGGDLGMPDLPVADLAHDAAVAPAGLGAPCSTDTQCTDGPQPMCFRQMLFNQAGKIKTPQGYCSSTCNSDADCTDHGVCLPFSDETKKYCFLACASSDQCRPGYACFRYSGGYCFPSGNLNCDPTVPGGLCSTAPSSNPGGCIRAAWGTGEKGFCNDSCTVGATSCIPAGGSARQCVVYNQTGTRDPSGALTGDLFHGAICINNYSMNAEGQECAAMSAGGGTADFLDACADGLECDLANAFAGGDNRCRRLCVEGGDGGAAPVDGGASGCPAGKSCTDVFGLFGTAKPIGLCR